MDEQRVPALNLRYNPKQLTLCDRKNQFSRRYTLEGDSVKILADHIVEHAAPRLDDRRQPKLLVTRAPGMVIEDLGTVAIETAAC
jgi:hypothetical protein